MKSVFALLRGIRTGIVVIPAIAAHIVIGLVGRAVISSPTRRLAFHARMTHVMSRVGLFLLGVRARIEAFDRYDLPASPSMIVANHQSYLDILILAAARPMLFVSSVEVERTPFLGLMASLGGTIFVERRSATGLRREIDRIADTLGRGFTVCIFPEGTTSRGIDVLPFKSPLLAAAGIAKVDVIPVGITYTSIDSAPFGDDNRDTVAWYGDMTFAPHFLRLLTVSRIDAVARFCTPVPSDDAADRKHTADKAREAVRQAFLTA